MPDRTCRMSFTGAAISILLLLPLPYSGRTLSNNRLAGPEEVNTSRPVIYFEPNKGQAHSSILYICRKPHSTVLLTANGSYLEQIPSQAKASSHVVRWQLSGSSSYPEIIPGEELPGKSNYLQRPHQGGWVRNVPHYSSLTYRGIYPGIDLVYYGNPDSLEFDFVVLPGANPGQIRFDVAQLISDFTPGVPIATKAESPKGEFRLQVDNNGDLTWRGSNEEWRWQSPRAYQRIGNDLRQVEVRYHLLNNQQLSFILGAYDQRLPLIIDPVLSYSSYWGGTGEESALSVATDPEGSIYLTGVTDSATLPASKDSTPGTASVSHGGKDAFVTKWSSAGELIYSTFLGGSGDDVGLGIAVDSDGHAYVLGGTTSVDFPVTSETIQSNLRGSRDFFVCKLSAGGDELAYSTYLGGTGPGDVEGTEGGIVIDQAGSAFITGSTNSQDFPISLEAFQTEYGHGESDAIAAKIDPSGTRLVYATYLGGSGMDKGRSIAVDSLRHAYVTGQTQSRDFPTLNGVQTARSGASTDAFIVKLDADGSLVTYATYLGGELDDDGCSIAVQDEENVYVTGSTYSRDFPVTSNVFKDQSDRNDETVQNADAFLAKLDTTLTGQESLLYSTFLGGSGDDFGRAVAVNSAGNVVITGLTRSTDFPVVDALQSVLGGSGLDDAFLAKINPEGLSSDSSDVQSSNTEGIDLIYSTYLGGSGRDQGLAVAVDKRGSVWVAGTTESFDFPLSSQPFQAERGGISDAFLVRVAYGNGEPANPVVTSGIAFTPSGPYETGQEIIAEFTVTNQGGTPIEFKHLTLSVKSASPTLPDFTWENDLVLDPGESHQYEGSLTLTAAGTFPLAVTYQTPDGKWHSDLPVDSGASSTVDILVDQKTTGTDPANEISSSSEDDKCSIPFGGTTCSTTISWKGINVSKDEVKVMVQDVGVGGSPVLFEEEVISGSKELDSIEGYPHRYRFTLNQERDGTLTSLAAVEVTGEEADPPSLNANLIRATLNPCVVGAGESQCSTSIVWQAAEGVQQARVYVEDVGIGASPELFSEPDSSSDFLNVSGELPAPSIQAAPHRYIFTLYQVESQLPVTRLAAVEVTAQNANSPSNASGTLTVSTHNENNSDACCSMDVTWTTRDYVSQSRVVYEDLDSRLGPQLLGRTLSGSATATELVEGHRYRFVLYQVDSGLLVTLKTADSVARPGNGLISGRSALTSRQSGFQQLQQELDAK